MRPPKVINDPFTEEARRILDSAAGYLGLGMIDEANQELQKFSPDLKLSREVLRLRVLIYCEVRMWEKMLEVSRLLISEWPEESDHWVWLASSTRRCRSIAEAAEVLSGALPRHEEEATVHYNLACYASQIGSLVIALGHLARAIELNPDIRAVATKEADLEPLWADLGAI